MSNMDNKKTIIDALEIMILEAEKNGQWLESTYQNILFTPKELRQSLSDGKFVWGPVNWRSVDPNKYLKNEEKEIEKIREHNKSILDRMNLK